MSLEKFMGSRLVVQPPWTRIYDAIRAMEENRIGAVLVHDGESLVGIVTDRDMALKVAGSDLDAFELPLFEIMTSPVASVPSSASVVDVAQRMIEHRVRRMPIVDGAQIRGIVTLDDLILEHAVDAFTLAAIVRSQLSEPARLKPAGSARPGVAEGRRARAEQRREARRQTAYATLVKRTLEYTGLVRPEDAERALEVVLEGLVRRAPPDEAGDLLAQLPSRLREHVVASVPSGPDFSVSRGSIERALEASLDIGEARARTVLTEVGHALAHAISAGELEDFRGTLPADMKDILKDGVS